MYYICENCGKEFIDKFIYVNHLKRKTPCSKEGREKLENKNYECDLCNKKFINKQTLIRHKEKYCKGYNEEIQKIINNKESFEKALNDLNSKNIKNENIEDLENKKKFNNNKISKCIIGNNNSYVDNTKTTQNIHNTQNIQILVNPFGNESTIPIPDSLYFEAIKNLVKGIPLLIKYVHYNPKYPENQNIKGKGLCSKYIEVHDGEDWKIDSKKNIIHNLITDKKDKLDDFVDEQVEKNKISKSLAYRYEKQTEKLDEVLNEDFRKEKASDESINLFKELEEEVNMTIENEKNKAKKKKKLE
jgi:hypothetical protein